MPQSRFLTILHERGFIHQCTDETALDALLAGHEKDTTPLVAYIGFDCTAASLHAGSLLQIMALRWLQKCGHKPIVLLGGGTTKVGDPSGKDESRQLLDEATIQQNMAGIRQVFEQFLEFEKDCHPGECRGPVQPDAVMRRHDNEGVIGHNSESFNAHSTHAILVNNDDWLRDLHYIDFLRDYGRLFSVNRMLGMESVKLRLEREHHLSFLEFNYMILQAYDFVELHQRYGCRLQLGGSDQWGNIVMGTELHRKKMQIESVEKNVPDFQEIENKTLKQAIIASTPGKRSILFGLTTPLLTTASGVKMGKTAEGAVWLDAAMTSAYDYWQYWRNTEDGDVGRFLRLFTELPLEEIAKLEALEGQGINEAKKVLATEATALLHGREAAEAAARTAQETFEQGGTSATLPEAGIPVAELEDGTLPAFKLFHLAGLAASGKEARRLISGGGAKLNDAPVQDENAAIALEQLAGQGPVKLSAGKKRHMLVRLA